MILECVHQTIIAHIPILTSFIDRYATDNLIEIKTGLKAGYIIVLTGAYLINSEFIFQNWAKLMDGMKM